MKKRGMILFMVIVLVLSGGCSFLYSDPTSSSAVIDVTVAEEAWMVPEMLGVTQAGEEWSTTEMNGQWWIAKTIFTRCPTVCMTMTPNMVKIQEKVAKEELDLKIISFTVDPEFDIPEQLEKYGQAYDANFENWDFITGYSQEEIEDFALKTFKQIVMKVPEQEDVIHPIRFYLVNPQGQIVRMYEGEAQFDLKATMKDLKSLLDN